MRKLVSLLASVIRDRGETSVIRMIYQGEDGIRKRRYVSPYGFTSSADDAFTGMDLTDGGLKQFKIDRCSEVSEYPSRLVFMNPLDGGPMPMEILEGTTT